MSKQLVKLRGRLSSKGKKMTYFLDYVDEDGKRKRTSLGHSNRRKAEKQRAEREYDLLNGYVSQESMKLSYLMEDSMKRTRGQVRESTLVQHQIAMKRLIETIGDIDFKKVNHRHGETYIQACLDRGNSPATANKNIRSIKRIFQLAVERGFLEANPFQYVRKPKVPRRKIRVYSDDECSRLIQAANRFTNQNTLPWDLLIVMALCTGMRRGELLNATWKDIDFEALTIDVSPKKNSDTTWTWYIKDNERRVLPLTYEVIKLLVEAQINQQEGCPYIFVPFNRYEGIQKRRRVQKWTIRNGTCPVNNFTRHFKMIQNMSGIEHGEFHDLRRTCFTRWLTNGLSEFDVMNLAGHSDFETTRRFYLAIRQDLVQCARVVSQETMKSDFGTLLAHSLKNSPQNKCNNTIKH